MPRFFLTDLGGLPALGDEVTIDGEDARHISRVLRMRPGEALTLCDGKGNDLFCTVTAVDGEAVRARVEECRSNRTESPAAIILYQGLPKGDKMEWIVQKAVELGVRAVVPVETSRSVTRLDATKGTRKQERWQKIAREAACQCERGILPTVSAPLPWREAVARWQGERTVAFYEGGGVPLERLVGRDVRALSLVIGPEGGFSPEEVEDMRKAGAAIATLGPRILRCETAPLAALAVVQHLTGGMER